MKANLPEDRGGRKEQRAGQEGQVEEMQPRNFRNTSCELLRALSTYSNSWDSQKQLRH